ncbi:MAG TPA: hypothetical protein DCG47_01675 [Spirochaetaceae bacterium]|nr:hypothetical protein [Spirochaetaceae bacterium]
MDKRMSKSIAANEKYARTRQSAPKADHRPPAQATASESRASIVSAGSMSSSYAFRVGDFSMLLAIGYNNIREG